MGSPHCTPTLEAGAIFQAQTHTSCKAVPETPRPCSPCEVGSDRLAQAPDPRFLFSREVRTLLCRL